MPEVSSATDASGFSPGGNGGYECMTLAKAASRS